MTFKIERKVFDRHYLHTEITQWKN